jgi:hypothetical protein
MIGAKMFINKKVVILFIVFLSGCGQGFYQNSMIRKYGYAHNPVKYMIEKYGEPDNVINLNNEDMNRDEPIPPGYGDPGGPAIPGANFNRGEIALQWRLGKGFGGAGGIDNAVVILTAVCEYSMTQDEWIVRWIEKTSPSKEEEIVRQKRKLDIKRQISNVINKKLPKKQKTITDLETKDDSIEPSKFDDKALQANILQTLVTKKDNESVYVKGDQVIKIPKDLENSFKDGALDGWKKIKEDN